MLTSLARLCILALLAQLGYTADLTLVLPHTLRSGETPWLQVKVGPIPRGEEIEIATTAGRFLGVISPFGIRKGRDAGTYTIPLPVDAISGDRVSLRLSINTPGQAQRAPTKDEVKGVILKIAGPAR